MQNCSQFLLFNKPVGFIQLNVTIIDGKTDKTRPEIIVMKYDKKMK